MMHEHHAADVAASNYRDSVLDLYRRHVNAGQAKLATLMGLAVERSSSGAYVTDHTGRRYLDVGGYGVFLLGHGHPGVVSALVDQLRANALSTRLLINAEQAKAAAVLAAHCPPGLQYVFFCNSGTEAVEAGLKLAQLNDCETVISTHGGYHGKTLGSLSVTGNEKYRSRFSARLGATRFVDYGSAAALEAALCTEPGKACVILEPIQAEAGVIVPPHGYLREVRNLCDHYGALLIFDEIQCGMGRTGAWWACDREGVVPDLMLVGKSLSGGCIPVGAMAASAAVYEPFNRNPLLHSSTFGGNPLAMTAVVSTFAVMDRDGLVALSEQIGESLLQRMRAAVVAGGWEKRVVLRGAGLLIGIEFGDASEAASLVIAMLERGVIVCHSLNEHRVVRLTPPATLVSADCDFLINAFTSALAKALN